MNLRHVTAGFFLGNAALRRHCRRLEMQCERCREDEADWAALHAPLLQKIVQLALGGNSSLPFGRYLMHHDSRAAAETTHAAVVALSLVRTPEPVRRHFQTAQPGTARLAHGRLLARCPALPQVCRRWREAVQAVLQQGSWRVQVEREAAAAAHGLSRLLTTMPLALSHLDMRLLSRTESPAAAGVGSLLRDPGFRRRSAATLRVLLGLPERFAAALAPFAALEVVGLVEDYTSTQSHLGSMQLGALAALPCLRRLHLEAGVAELAALPPRVAELALLDIDRLALPPARGASVVDRLLAAAEVQGECWAGGAGLGLGLRCWRMGSSCWQAFPLLPSQPARRCELLGATGRPSSSPLPPLTSGPPHSPSAAPTALQAWRQSACSQQRAAWCLRKAGGHRWSWSCPTWRGWRRHTLPAGSFPSAWRGIPHCSIALPGWTLRSLACTLTAVLRSRQRHRRTLTRRQATIGATSVRHPGRLDCTLMVSAALVRSARARSCAFSQQPATHGALCGTVACAPRLLGSCVFCIVSGRRRQPRRRRRWAR